MYDTSVNKNTKVNQVSSRTHFVRAGINLIGFFIGDNMKTCSKCQEIKPLSEFHKNKTKKDGLNSFCKSCQKAYDKAYNLANSVHLKIIRKAYYKANSEKMKAAAKANQLANSEKIKIRRKAFYKKHAEKCKKRAREYRKAHLEQSKLHDRKRKAFRCGVKHKPYATNYVFERDGWICQLCGRKINKRLKYPNPRSGSIDHIVPLSRGGNDSPVNVQATHLRCNLGKNATNKGQLRLFG